MPDQVLDFLLCLLSRLPDQLTRMIGYPVFCTRFLEASSVSNITPSGDYSIVFTPALITNRGRRVAENCYPQLIFIHRIDGQRKTEFEALPLMWGDQDETAAGDEVQYRDIQPGGSCELILAQQRADMVYWEITSARWPNGVRTMITLGPGSYEVAINLVGDNFYMPAYRYCVCLQEDGNLEVCPPPSRWQVLRDKLPRRQ